jgi:hypothetical protein
MPKLNSTPVKHRMAEAGLRYAKHLAEATGLPFGRVRGAINGRDPLKLMDIYDIARVLKRDDEDIRDVVAEITADDEDVNTNDGVPDEPPKQPKPQKAPPKRSTKSGTGPKRAQGSVAA